MMNKMSKMSMKTPLPSSISMKWNMGSILSIMMMIQITTGLMISMTYNPNIMNAFKMSMMINRNMNMGFMMKMIHMNMVSMMFIIMYMHLLRNIWNNSQKIKMTWTTGFMMMMMMMITAFMGYVLPWGQMSFWGATVITNMMSSIPYMGNEITKVLWGNFSVSNPTLNRFFTIHFMIPMLMMLMIMLHIMSLHNKGSTNQMGLNSNIEKSNFHPEFSIKDMLYISLTIMMTMLLMNNMSKMFTEPENFMMANSMSTPNHIKPEWYFLFAYSILRTIPNKLGGVMMMFMSMLLLLMLMKSKKSKNSKFNMKSKVTNMLLMKSLIMLTFTGAKEIEEPMTTMSYKYTMLYFIMMLSKMN